MEKVNLYVDQETTNSPYFIQTIEKISNQIEVEVNPPRRPSEISVNLNPKESFRTNEASLGYIHEKDSSFIKDNLTVILETHHGLGILSPFTEEELHHLILLGRYNPNQKKTSKGVSIDIVGEDEISKEVLNQIDESISEINLYSNTKNLPKIPYQEGLKVRQLVEKDEWSVKNQWVFKNKFLNLEYKDKFVQFLSDAMNLSARFVLIDEEYELVNAPSKLTQTQVEQLEKILSLTEKFYELLQFGMKYSKYILEDTQKDEIDFSQLKKSQDTIENIIGQVNLFSSKLLFFSIPEQFLMTNIKYMPPGSITEMAINQHDAFETTSLIIQVYFDLLKNLKNKIHPEKIFPC